eukprot:TRINITY_DN17246_c0_g1_i1.p1 TRINITY_DN17246_c0_g1~~TRINITY_DN17246_c0_g1_i1.p1  ORF type:complete len:441 (+),score=76.73 TRINITY_DN17246_c0_g1_i1:155-1477(+)
MLDSLLPELRAQVYSFLLRDDLIAFRLCCTTFYHEIMGKFLQINLEVEMTMMNALLLNFVRRFYGNQYIRTLTAQAASISDIPMMDFSKLPSSVTALNLTRCCVTDKELEKLPAFITKLDITGNFVTNLCVAGFPSGLISLTANDTMLSDRCFPNLPRGLKYLSLINTKRVEGGHFDKLPQDLKTLKLSNGKFRSIEGLEKLSNLQELQLTENHIRDEDYRFLPQSLVSLNLSDTHINHSVVHVPSKVTNLVTAHTRINSDSLRNLPAGICKLSLKECDNISDWNGLLNLKMLSELDASYSHFSDAALDFLPPTISRLSINRTKVTANGINALAGKVNLRLLEISDCSELELKNITSLPPSLVVLNISRFSNFSEDVDPFDASALPRKLLSLLACGVVLPDEAIYHLPSTIQVLAVSESGVSEAGKERLKRMGIKHLELV